MDDLCSDSSAYSSLDSLPQSAEKVNMRAVVAWLQLYPVRWFWITLQKVSGIIQWFNSMTLFLQRTFPKRVEWMESKRSGKKKWQRCGTNLASDCSSSQLHTQLCGSLPARRRPDSTWSSLVPRWPRPHGGECSRRVCATRSELEIAWNNLKA